MNRYLVTITAMALAMTISGCGANPSKEGLELLEQQKYKEAAVQFQKAIEKDKNIDDAYRGLGIARWETEDYEGAREAFEYALQNDAKKTATLYNFLGNCEMKLDNPKSALNYYRLGMEADDCSEDMKQQMRFNEIAAYEQMEDWESAKAKLTSYTQDYPEDEQAAKEAEFLETR